MNDEDETRLRAAALKNAEAVLIARQRAERELREAKEALERRTDELLEQRQWLEVTLASIGDAVISTDTAGQVAFLNPVAETMTGWTSAEAQGRPVAELFRIIDEFSGEVLDNPIRRVIETGEVVGLANHAVLISRSGTRIAIEDSAAPIRDAGGDVRGAIMVFHDVTVRRGAEQALRTSEARFRATFNLAAVGIAVANPDGRFVEANQRFCELLGYSLEELRTRTFMDLTQEEDREATRVQVARLRAREIPHYTIEKRYVRKDGAVLWSNTTVTLVHDAAGGATQYIGVVQDIGERRRAAEVQARLAALVESSEDAIISKTLDGTIVTWNQGAQRMFGYSAQEMVGSSIMRLIPPDRADEEPIILAKVRRGERIEPYETVRQAKDGRRVHVSLSVSPIRDVDGRIFGASKIARDITRQKLEEQRRERAEAALRETDRRKDEFLATLAHELRNPLAPIRQAAAISKAQSATDAQKRWSHEVISRQVHHMALLLDDLLDISRITRGTLELRIEPTELAAVIDAAIETARPVIDAKRHHFSLQMPPEPLYLTADPLRLAQVLSNLLTNAAKYTDPQGRIALRVSRVAAQIQISVEDTGIGIPADALHRLFSMFSQVKASQDRSEGGLGIGLALAKGLVELHGGTIEAHSAGPGRGSEFIVRLPVQQAEVRPPQSSRTPGGEAVPRRVLIADDNRDAAESLAVLLRMDGHEVTVVNDGARALQAFQTVRPEVALLDIGMPELNGYEVARRVRKESAGAATLLVAVTGWGQENDKARARTAGFDHHFTKPVDPDELLALLRAPSTMRTR